MVNSRWVQSLEELRAGDVPSQEVKVRWRPHVDGAGRHSPGLPQPIVAVYDPAAVVGTSPIVLVTCRIAAAFATLEQGTHCTARGLLVPGEAIGLVLADGATIDPAYPALPVYVRRRWRWAEGGDADAMAWAAEAWRRGNPMR